ncbi:MAG: hypothetical protein RLZZ568_822 [Cyanobacteriota bacterium]
MFIPVDIKFTSPKGQSFKTVFSMTYKIANYLTNVNLAESISTNLVEIELALKNNPGQFTNLVLFDQARGSTDAAAFPSGWNGVSSYYQAGFSQDIWRETGIAIAQPSLLPETLLPELWDDARQFPGNYADDLEDFLRLTGSTSSQESIPPDYNLGITTVFNLLSEMQTGSPLTVDYLLDQANTANFFNQNPHALFLSNHGGSFLLGGNGDGPAYDLDEIKRNLQVTELEQVLQQAIIDYSPDQNRFGLLAYDECLMANIETATELRGVTRYLLASQETIPGLGYDYFLTLSDFKTNTPLSSQTEIEQDSRALGEAFVSTYSGRNGASHTLSLTDTDGITLLNQAIKSYADAFLESDDSLLVDLLKALRVKGTNYTYKFLQDLGNLALISQALPGASSALIEASQAILAALDTTIVANNQDYRPWAQSFRFAASSGLTITLPTELTQVVVGGEYLPELFIQQAPQFEDQTGWSRVLARVAPLLQRVQTNSGFEPAQVERKNGSVIESQGGTARFAVQINGYLGSISNDAAINNDIYNLPELANAILADLNLSLDILNLREAGSVTIAIRSADGLVKATWSQAVTKPGLLTFSTDDLNAEVAAQPISEGDQVVITPIGNISAAYDFNLQIADQKLQGYNSEKPLDYPTLLNTSLIDDGRKELFFTTPPLLPEPDGGESSFCTNLVLLSGSEGYAGLTLFEVDGTSLLTLESADFIDEQVRLKPNTEYSVTLSYRDFDPQPSDLSSDLSFLFDYFAAPTQILNDSLLRENIFLSNWGQISVNPGLSGTATIVETVSSKRITALDDLREGDAIDALYVARSVDIDTTLQAGTGGGTQTYASGLWTASNDVTLNVFVEGIGANNAQLGFYQVDALTGAISTDSGLIMPSATENYLAATRDSLVSPLIALNEFNKEGVVEVNLMAGQHYAAVLITEDQNGSQTALYSLTAGNPNASIQFLDFGRGYYGFEDLVQGRDSGWDGDFNDVTFYLT